MTLEPLPGGKVKVEGLSWAAALGVLSQGHPWAELLPEPRPDEWVLPTAVAEHRRAKKILARTLERNARAYRKLLALGLPPQVALYALPLASTTALLLHPGLALQPQALAQEEISTLLTTLDRLELDLPRET